MTERTCAKHGCDAERLPHMAHCYEHVARYEIPPPAELACPACGHLGPHGTLHDSLYYCIAEDCGELFDPRRSPYLDDD